MLRPVLLAAVAAAALGGAALTGHSMAQSAPPAASASPSIPRTISVNGVGHSQMTPDNATLSLGVSTNAATAREALDANSAAMTGVIDGLKELGFGVTDMQTTGLGLSPQYNYDNNSLPKLIGYQANNGVTLRVKDIARLGEVIDIVVGKGANQVNTLTFDVADKTAAMDEARRKAVENAREKAQIMASAAGATVGRVISISEGYVHSPGPVAVQTMRADSAASVPIASGEVGLEAQVSVVFELN